MRIIIYTCELQSGDTIIHPKTNEVKKVYRVDINNIGYINVWWSEDEMDRYRDGSIFDKVDPRIVEIL